MKTKTETILTTLGNERCQQIISLYKSRNTIAHISTSIGVPRHWIRKVLLQHHISILSGGSFIKWNPTEFEKKTAIQLYSVENRGIQYIAKYFKTSWKCVSDYFNKWGVPKKSRSDLQRANRIYYGNTKGFTGKTHTKNSKNLISTSLKGNANRKATGPKSQFIETSIGKVQGTFEVAYLQKCLNENTLLPSTGSTVRTPYGLYYPDFEYAERFIEVKSPFTWDVCRGFRENGKGIKSDAQHRKIKWVDKNVKPVKILVMDEKEVYPLFKQAIKNKALIYDNIIWKRGRYYKNEPLDLH